MGSSVDDPPGYFTLLFDDEASVEYPDGVFRCVGMSILQHLERRRDAWAYNPALSFYFTGKLRGELISQEEARCKVRSWDLATRCGRRLTVRHEWQGQNQRWASLWVAYSAATVRCCAMSSTPRPDQRTHAPP